MNCFVGDHRTTARYKVTARWALINGCLGKGAWSREMLSTSADRGSIVQAPLAQGTVMTIGFESLHAARAFVLSLMVL